MILPEGAIFVSSKFNLVYIRYKWCYVNVLPHVWLLSSSMNRQFVFPCKSARFLYSLYKVFCVMSLDRHKYCCDPFKKHRCRIYSNLRVAPEKLIAEYPSLSLRSGDLLCVNCLIAFSCAKKKTCISRGRHL